MNFLFHQRPAPRVFLDRNNPLEDATSDKKLKGAYRLPREAIRELVDLVDPVIGPATKRSCAISTEVQVKTFKNGTNMEKSKICHAIFPECGYQIGHYLLTVVTATAAIQRATQIHCLVSGSAFNSHFGWVKC